MRLKDQIAQFKAGRPAPPPEVLDAVKRGMEWIRTSGATGLRIGEQAPDFTLPNQVGKKVRLADRLASGPVVLSFYRGEW